MDSAGMGKRAMANDRLSVLARKKIAEAQRRRWQQLRGALAATNRRPRDPEERVAKPPRSPLWGRLIENLGRELQDDEAKSSAGCKRVLPMRASAC
jgi:hypothetical protein